MHANYDIGAKFASNPIFAAFHMISTISYFQTTYRLKYILVIKFLICELKFYDGILLARCKIFGIYAREKLFSMASSLKDNFETNN